MSFDLEEIIVDEKLAKEGVWFDFYGDSKLLIASKENGLYRAEMAKLAKKYELQLSRNGDDYDKTQLVTRLTAEVTAKVLLLDWKNIKWNGVENAPYTWEAGRDALLKSSTLSEFVTSKAEDTSNYKEVLIEEVKKPSNGTSLGDQPKMS